MSFTCTWSDVIKRAPELKTIACDIYETILEDVSLIVNESHFGDQYNMACALLAAHFGTMEQRGNGQSGAVQSESVGSVSRSFGFSVTTDPDLGTTSYGLRFLKLAKTKAASAGFVLC